MAASEIVRKHCIAQLELSIRTWNHDSCGPTNGRHCFVASINGGTSSINGIDTSVYGGNSDLGSADGDGGSLEAQPSVPSSTHHVIWHVTSFVSTVSA
eukprot:571234-Rhodomonas_salina.2